jgi:DNA polymerase-1
MIYLITTNPKYYSCSDYTVSNLQFCLDTLSEHDEIEVDTETTGYDVHTCKVLTVQFGVPNFQFVVDCESHDLTVFKELLESDKLFLFQNAKFDLRFFLKKGIRIQNIYDTFLAESILTTGIESRELGLAFIAHKYCGVFLNKSIRKQIHIEGLTTRVIRYAAEDVAYLSEIKRQQLIELEKLNLLEVLKLENTVVKVFARMEFTGVLIDPVKWSEVAKLTEEESERLEKELDDVVLSEPKLRRFVPAMSQLDLFGVERRRLEINWGSPKQKLDILAALGFKTDTTGDRFLQVNKKKHILIAKLIEFNKFNKLASAFGFNFLKFINKETGRIHFNVKQILSTGRISVSEPNLNQIPSKGELGKKIRSCFIAKPGYKIVGGDYSGAELRIIAAFSKDPIWVNAFIEGEDLHSVLCAATFNIPITDVKTETPFKAGVTYRDVQKTVNFGLAYGMSKFKLSDTLQISLEEADGIITKFFTAVPKVKTFLHGLAKLGTSRGFIRTAPPFGRIRFFEGHDSENPIRHGEIERASMNTPIQGTNGDLIKVALIKIQDFIDANKLDINILLSVYDEIQTECPESIAEWWREQLNRLMLEAAEVIIKDVPFVVDCKVSDCWQK